MAERVEKYFGFKMEIPPHVRFILERLRENNFDAYIVGGAVRDSILGRSIPDWDITTSGSTGEIRRIFNDTRQYSLKHETVTLVKSKKQYEITVMKGRVKKIEKDLAHRDFTVNAMAYDDTRGIVLDPYMGKKDLEGKCIRGVSDPCARFEEDPLRILRAVRLASELGFAIETETMECISNMSGKLESVSVERIRDELRRILLAEKPSKWINILRKTGVLDEIIPELSEGYRKKQNKWHRYTVYRHIMASLDRVPPVLILRLSALLHDIAKPRVREKINGEFHFYAHEKKSALMAGEIMERLKFAGNEIKKVTALVSLHMIDYKSSWSEGAVRRLIRRAGAENINDLLLLRRADILAHGSDNDYELSLLDELEQRIKKAMAKAPALDASDLKINGKEIMDILGIKRGPRVGNAIKMLLDIVMDDPDLNSGKKLRKLLLEAKARNRV